MKSALSLFLIMALVWNLTGAVPGWTEDRLPPLSLPELIQEVKRVNPEILMARKKWQAAQEKIPLSKGLPPPRIGVEFEEIPRGTVKLNQATILYQLIQSLPFPGKLSLRQQVAVKEAQIAAFAFKQAEWDVLTHLKSAYYELFMIDRELEIQQEQISWLTQAVATAQSRYATGALSHLEFLRAQAELLETSNMVRVLQQRRLVMEAHVNHHLNREAHMPVGHPSAIELHDVPSDPDELFAVAQVYQPELLALQFSVERAQASVKLAKRELLPDLETMVELRDPAMGPFGPWDLTLALVLPFWFWTKQKHGVRVALYDLESTQAAFQAIRNEVTKWIHENWHQAKASYETAQLCQEGLIPQAKQAVASALAGYRAGKIPFGDLLDSLQDLSERKRTYYQHLIELEQKVVSLEQAVGVPLRPLHREA